MRVVQVGVGIANDASRLLQDWEVEMGNIMDIRDVAFDKRIIDRRNCPLKELLEKTCNASLDKEERLSAWEQTPLTEQQIKYAALDSLAVLKAYQATMSKPGMFLPGALPASEASIGTAVVLVAKTRPIAIARGVIRRTFTEPGAGGHVWCQWQVSG
jgi:3'-5' exonuclease